MVNLPEDFQAETCSLFYLKDYRSFDFLAQLSNHLYLVILKNNHTLLKYKLNLHCSEMFDSDSLHLFA